MKRKTRIERVYNEDTGWFETREVELNSYSFTDDDRIMIVREYMESGLPAEEIIKKYYISSRTVLFSWMDKFLTSNPQPIGFSGILLAKRQNSFYCTYFLHNRNVADTKSPYPIKRLEVIRWFNQKSMVFNQSLS